METATFKNVNYNQTGNALRIENSIVSESVQKQIANAFYLYLNYKYYHWQTSGPLFRDLHIIFDEFATEVYDTIESLSERIKVGGQKRIRLMDFPKAATVKPSKTADNVRRMLEEAAHNESVVVLEMSEVFKTAKRIDPVTANILKKLLMTHKNHHWWLSYILEKRQGLTV